MIINLTLQSSSSSPFLHLCQIHHIPTITPRELMTPNTMANISLRLSPLFPFVWLVVDGRVEVVVADDSEVDEFLDVCEVDDVVVDVGGGGADDDVVVDVGG